MTTTDQPTDQTSGTAPDPYAAKGEDFATGTVYTAAGADWDEIATAQADRGDERIVVNMGP